MKMIATVLAGVLGLTTLTGFAANNLLQNSEDFADSAWKSFRKEAVIGEKAEPGPDKKLNAFKLQISKEGYMGQIIKAAIPGKCYNFSVWMKSATGADQKVQLVGENNPPALSVKCVPFNVTSEWQKFTLSFTCPSGGNNYFRFSIRNCDVYVAAPEVIESKDN